MRPFILIAIPVMLSCRHNSDDKESIPNAAAIIVTVPEDTIVKKGQQFYKTPGEAAVNGSLSKNFGGQWHVMNDREGKWIREAFNTFIVPKRKEYPDYPYITQGDFNDDGITDTAAVITDKNKKEFRVAVLLSNGEVQLWKEGVLINAALSTAPKGSAVDGGTADHPKKIKMLIDGIKVEYFEQASFVLYQSGKSLNRIKAGD
jgi:hypothetical protein